MAGSDCACPHLVALVGGTGHARPPGAPASGALEAARAASRESVTHGLRPAPSRGSPTSPRRLPTRFVTHARLCTHAKMITLRPRSPVQVRAPAEPTLWPDATPCSFGEPDWDSERGRPGRSRSLKLEDRLRRRRFSARSRTDPHVAIRGLSPRPSRSPDRSPDHHPAGLPPSSGLLTS
jgi:hypothetical protein